MSQRAACTLVLAVLAASATACAGPSPLTEGPPGRYSPALRGQGEALPPPAATPPPADTCGRNAYVGAIGRKAAETELPPDGPAVRRLWPDSMATMDHAEGRMNIMLDAGGVITGFTCG